MHDSTPTPPAGDPRRRIPRTDVLLADERFADAVADVGVAAVKAAIAEAQQRVRAGAIPPEAVVEIALEQLPRAATTLRPVVNATGVVVHTNIGRAPLSEAAVRALQTTSGYVDVEFDPSTARRAARGRGTLAALLDRVPGAGGALVVNNGASALLLAALTFAGDLGTDGGRGREILVSRGELIEIGDGFRLPELLRSAGVVLREVGMTNRTHLADYADAIGPNTGAVLKIHTSNYRVEGFAGVPGVAELASLGVPVIADVGSGLLTPEPTLPDEPDVATWLREGARLVTASGDKLLGGPQAGLVLGDAEVVERVRRHPMARAMRADKLALAALEATLRGPVPPVVEALRRTREGLRPRTERLAAALADVVTCEVVEVNGRVGGGGAPGVPLPSLAVALPEEYAVPLRHGDPCVVARVAHGRCLVDLRCVPPSSDDAVIAAVRRIAKNSAGESN